MDRRAAQKRGAGRRPEPLDEARGAADERPGPGESYERAVFDAKVGAAIRATERDCGFLDFSIYRMRVLDGRSGREVARSLGTSEPTVSRKLAAVRERLRERLVETFSKYSFTADELSELTRNGLDTNPNKKEQGAFDEAVAEVYGRLAHRRDASGGPSTAGPRPYPDSHRP